MPEHDADLNDAPAAFSHDQDPTQRVEATTTPEGEKGWETVQSRHTDTARGHGVDVAPDSQPEGVRVETRRTNDGDRGGPSNAPTAATSTRFLHMCICEPWAQRWKAEEPERCVTCGGMFPTHTVEARRV